MTSETQPRWYQDAIIYQLHVKVYRDSNGDGVGDFRGLLSKLDYLQELGITAIWLLPFYPSPLRDDGYDTADYRKVHPSYGDLRQFKSFVKAAKQRGLRVITELVLNHTSDQHEWFQRARRAPAGHPHRDFYVWSDTMQRYEDTRIIFQDFEPSNWTWDPVADAYFWHRFYSHQPDLNWENPTVVEELYRIVDYWLDMGVDGLRLDAVPYLFEREGTNCENLPETHEALKQLRAHVDANHDDKMLLAEANMWPDEVVDYFGDGDECHMAFHFPLMPRMFMAIRMEDRFPIIDILDQTPDIPEGTQWAIFLRNHDELTLEMVTDEERDYMWRIYAEDERARINLGIRRRLAPLLGNNRRLIELMNSLLFSLPGTPVIYYGDEIGMGDNIYLGDRDGVRTPMQWSADRNAGFSDANPQKLYLPVVSDPEYHSSAINVEAQQANPESLLWWTRRMISLRKRHSALGHGDLQWVPSDNRKVLTYMRSTENERILCVVNLSRHAQFVELDLSEFEGWRPVSLLGQVEFPVIGELPYMFTMGPHDYLWFVIEPAVADEQHPSRSTEVPTLSVRGDDWTRLLHDGRERRRIEALLPDYLRERRWFRAKGRRVRSAKITEYVPVGGSRAGAAGYLTFVEVDFADGDPQTYVLPLVAELLDPRPEHPSPLPPTTIARLHVEDSDEKFALYDGQRNEAFNRALLESIRRRRGASGVAGRFEGATTTRARQLRSNGTSEDPVPLSVEQSNSAVAYGDRYMLKLYRLVEAGENPDIEIGRYLTEQARFPYSPSIAGVLEYRPSELSGGAPRRVRTIALLQEYVENEGDAWNYTLDALRRFVDDALAHPETPALPTGNLVERTRQEPPAIAHEVIGPYLEAARLLGERTAQLHVALAQAPEDGELAAEPMTPMYRRSLYQSMRNAAKRTFATLRRLQAQNEAMGEVIDLEEQVLERLRGLLDIGLSNHRIRVHGDYHLGQVLWTGRDFRIIDFEGEPARPIGERRIKRLALRDVAGMLRSFDYAAWTVAQESGQLEGDGPQATRVMNWLEFWNRWVSASFLRSYLDTARAEGEFLTSDDDDLAMVLDALLMEKALYELEYEANNRPDWAWIPARGLRELLGADG